MKPEITITFKPNDLWIGFYWHFSKSIESAYRKLDIYVCILPMLPIRFRFEWGWK